MSEVDMEILGGRYQLRSQVARGGMTDVFLGYDTLLSRSVAIKRLFPEFATDHNFVERFRREATAAANLNHPNIVEVYDWGADFGTYFLIMEYIEGKSLAELISSTGPFGVDQAVEITMHVAAALGFAHSNGVIHRDVKPGNVLISPDGKVKVTDFGIAIAVLDNVDSNLTKIGSVVGTATYFSPEQAQGKALDHRSDLYSLGVVLYEMLCGRAPFVGDSAVAVAYKHVQEAVPLPSAKGIILPPALEAINMKLLAKDTASRYPTALDLQHDLRRYRERQNQTPKLIVPDVVAQTPQKDAPEVVQPVLAQPQDVDLPNAAVEPSSRAGLFTAAAVTFAAIAILLFFVLSNVLDTADDTPVVPPETAAARVDVPDTVGLSSDLAVSELRALGFEVDQITETSQVVPAGQVISQNPAASAQLEVGGQVQITISTGLAPLVVPGVVGELAQDATRFLQDRGLAVELFIDTESTAPEGQVLRQDPAPGTEVVPGTAVVLNVAGGPSAIAVPVVAEMTALRATQVLAQAGFEVSEETVQEPSLEIAEGLVISTDPSPPALLLPQTLIKLIISTGPATVEVPNVVGLTATAALVVLTAQELVLSEEVTVCDVQNVAAVPGAQILRQNPPANETHPVGTVITVCVGIGPVDSSGQPVSPDSTPSSGFSSTNNVETLAQRQSEAARAAAEINARSVAVASQPNALGSIAAWVALAASFEAECMRLVSVFADIAGIEANWNLEPPYPMPASAANAANWIEGIDGDVAGKDDGCVVRWN